MDVITLFTSDSRPKYINDALSVLSLPPGSRYQFRYELKYLPASVQALFEAGEVGDIRLLIAFKSEPKVVGDKTIIVPLRWARVVEVERITDFFVIRFSVEGYPVFRGNQVPSNRGSLEEISNKYLDSVPQSEMKLPVHLGATNLVETSDNADKNAWIVIARVMSFHKIFAEVHFLRVSTPTSDKGNELWRDAEGNFEIKEGNYLHIPIDYFASSYSESEPILEVIPDGQTLRIASGGKTRLDSRYDSIKVWLQAKDVSGRTRSEIQIHTEGGKATCPQTVVRMPLVVRNSVFTVVAKTLVSGLGAVLIAMPGLLGPSADLWLRGILAAAGALLVSLGLNVVGRMK